MVNSGSTTAGGTADDVPIASDEGIGAVTGAAAAMATITHVLVRTGSSSQHTIVTATRPMSALRRQFPRDAASQQPVTDVQSLSEEVQR
jgi:hypothetical protein